MMIGPKTIIELIGTAVLVFTIQVAVSSGSDLAPLAIGGVLVSLVFAGGPVSGGHYNPAVSLAIALRGKMEFPDMIAYAISQVLGGVLGGFVGGVVGGFNVLSAGEDASTLQALLAEGIFAFVLCFVVLSVATNPKAEDNHYYGLAIGLVVTAGAIGVGPISGGAFNPAVALGLSISGGFSNLLYVIMVAGANLLGGAVAAGCFRVVVPASEEVVPVGEQASLYQSVS